MRYNWWVIAPHSTENLLDKNTELSVRLKLSEELNRQLKGELESMSSLREVLETASGKSINVARTLHTLGHEVLASGFLGGQPGQFIRDDLDRSRELKRVERLLTKAPRHGCHHIGMRERVRYRLPDGTETGTTIFLKIQASEAPSIRAASIMSGGNVMKKLRKRKIPKGSAKAVCASHIPP